MVTVYVQTSKIAQNRLFVSHNYGDIYYKIGLSLLRNNFKSKIKSCFMPYLVAWVPSRKGNVNFYLDTFL